MSEHTESRARPVSLLTILILMVVFGAFYFFARSYYRPASVSAVNAAAENLPKELEWRATAEARRKALQEAREKEERASAGYAWIDRNAGSVQLPIRRAMELTAAEYGAKSNAGQQSTDEPMITSTIQTPLSEGTAVDLHARGPLLAAFGLAIGWLVVSGVLSLIAAIQLHSPAFLAGCEYLTHGRVRALAETSFVYGWAGGAGIAAVVLILGRLGGNPLQAANWFGAGSVFWNLGIAAGLVGIATGDMTSFSLLQLPRYVQPLLVFASAAMGIAGLLAWSGRRRDGTFASHWYGVAGLVLLPWALTAAQISLFWFPMRGILQAVGAAWYAEAVIFLWLAPLALACACYLAAKLTGRVLPSYEAAPLAFWMLIVVGTWSAGRHLVGGPVPAWIPTMAVFSFSMLLYHFAVVALNLRPVFGLGGPVGGALKFGVGGYLLFGAIAFLASFRGVALRTQFTHFASATEQLFLYGSVSMILFPPFISWCRKS